VAVVLDTDTLAPRERAEAVEAAMRFARVPAALTHDPDGDGVQARVETWELGGAVGLVYRVGTGISLSRTPRQVRSHAEERVSLTLLGPGRWRFTQGAVEQVVDRDRWGACLVDQSASYRFQRVGSSQMYAVGIDPATLGMPFDLVRKAADRVDRSPLLEMLTRHVLEVARVADVIPPGPARSGLGAATAELFRAVLSTALTGVEIPLEASGPTLLTMTRMYVDRHITNFDLTPGHIARAHNVSLRHLYAAWSGNDVSLAAYVMAQRLELARNALTERGTRARTIAAIARRCGFVDATHFSRRFRAAYGMSPREWRQLRAATDPVR
jgi:AraC-like DNA-binding protein